ncbi:MAG: transglutaminase [Sneathiella sp.]|jgi:transglutaminase-like putative cysteine protease|uniref:transglutaminase family protein n=1 Tax=Sneathiella sp. TaxID=1964365 RepID=UPI000C6689EF|nr:transglutaminase family protein [Sneathiella sp.]MAL80193.1 transglutaminase [Sneathiella sp.]|tara:strand:+ start:146 stop:949 length:804 start_codon:yes stop_codon:yes gene_type:complete
MLLKISHLTKYRYEHPVRYVLQQLRLMPKTGVGQTVLRWDVTLEGGARELEFDDQFNNHVMLVSTNPEGTEISIRCEGEVETTDLHGIIGVNSGFAPLWFFLRETPLTKPGVRIGKLIRELGRDYASDVAMMHELSLLIAKSVPYRTGETHAETTAEEALATANGVCQDHAHIFISVVRQLGFPARYVSGYLMMDDRIHQEATHAWAEAYLPDIGWVGFDVSNGISPDERYVRVSTGLDYKDAAPISGLRVGHGGEFLDVSLQVQQQ